MVKAEDEYTFDHLKSVGMFKDHYENVTKHKHLRELLQDTERNEKLMVNYNDSIVLDFTHTKIDLEGLRWLGLVADELKVADKIK